MTEPHLTYVGPLPNALADQSKKRKRWWQRMPAPFMAIVALPTLLAGVYFLVIASPRYVSEARFIVRSPGSNPSSFGVALQGVGLNPGQTDAFAVHEYIASLDGLRYLKGRFDLAAVLGPKGADFWARYPRPGEKSSDESMRKALERFVTVGYDSTTGISTLHVQAFSPQDAQALGVALLDGGEKLVNELNTRSARDAVVQAVRAREDASTKLAAIQKQLTDFRNRERFIDPLKTAAESSQLIGGLMSSVAQLQAERSQLSAEAPQSPLLGSLDGRIAAMQRQIEAERAKVAGDNSSLAPRITAYEELNLQRELATEAVSRASAAVIAAEQETRRQQLYLERIVAPTLPDEALEPRRWLAVLAVFFTALLVYGVGWLIWAGVREHRQD